MEVTEKKMIYTVFSSEGDHQSFWKFHQAYFYAKELAGEYGKINRISIITSDFGVRGVKTEKIGFVGETSIFMNMIGVGEIE